MWKFNGVDGCHNMLGAVKLLERGVTVVRIAGIRLPRFIVRNTSSNSVSCFA